MSQDTTAICLPKGTTQQRSGFTNEAGQIRYNTNSQVIEWYNGVSWKDITEGAITSTSGDYVTTSGGFKFHFFNQSGSFVNSGGTQVAQIYVIGAVAAEVVELTTADLAEVVAVEWSMVR